MDSCKNGHVLDEANTYVYKTGHKTCRTCHRETQRRRVHENPAVAQYNRDHAKAWRKAHPDRAKSVRVNWLAKIKALLSAAKANGCNTCPEKDPSCLDFHHKDPSKKSFNIGMQVGSYSIKRLQEELPKTVVLCSNCHRKLHAKERKES